MRPLRVLADIADDRVQLRQAFLAVLLLFLDKDRRAFPPVGQTVDGKLLRVLRIRPRRGSAVGGLEQFKDLIVAHLQIRAAGFFDLRGKRRFQHLIAVLLTLHLQAELKAGVRPDLLIYLSGGLLRCQNQMDAQTPADPRGGDEFFHEFRLLRFQLRKFINNDDQMRQRHGRLARAVFADIFVNVIDLCFGKQALALEKLCLDRPQRAVDLPAVDVRDRTQKMGQAAELVDHAAALEVDDDKCHLIGVEERRHGKDIRLQQFRFTGTGRTGDQAVRAVRLVVQIQTDNAAFRNAQRGHRTIDPRCHPALRQIQVLCREDVQQLKQRNVLCQRAFQRDLLRIDRRQHFREAGSLLIRNGRIAEDH